MKDRDYKYGIKQPTAFWDIMGSLLTSLVIVVPWLAGIAIAKGGWSTFFSIVFAPYAWYLTVEKLLMTSGVL